METESRVYDGLLSEHLAANRQMAFVSGPRQVGKTTTCRRHADSYRNWDNVDDRELLLAGPGNLAEAVGANRLSETPPVALFDELHKFPSWKPFLKGLYDTYGDRLRIIVTGSSRLDVYRRGGDSLMGRYFSYRMHPFSVAETVSRQLPDAERVIRQPRMIESADFEALWHHGGYPEPFLRRDNRFSRRWRSLRLQQLVREEIRDLTQVQQMDQMELLVRRLTRQSGRQLVFGNLAREVRVAADTVRRWVAALCDFHLGFLVRPWFRNVSRSLRKEPKWYLRDWADIEDVGQKAETFVACHLLKAVEGWNDMGLGRFELGYLRDKEKREVDFLVAREGSPWILVEVKYRDESLSRSLKYYQDQLKAPFAFQVVLDADFVDAD
ncbi:MAG: ATP-binding protein, partial [Deltaproteobacteria bacterium]|nr:ATP-binding protein [Deltaproteobacteria bacterium]